MKYIPPRSACIQVEPELIPPQQKDWGEYPLLNMLHSLEGTI